MPLLKGLTFIKQLASGCFGYTDLYRNANNNLFVLKTQKLLDTDVVRKNSKYKFAPNNRLNTELAFFIFVSKLHINERKYFMQMVEYEIIKSTNFDQTRLFKCGNDEIFAKLLQSKFIYRSLLTFAGEELGHYVDRAMDDYYDNNGTMSNANQALLVRMANDLLQIVKVTWNAGFIIDDLHSGNICWNGSNTVLIDYGEIKIGKNSQNIIHYRSYIMKWDLWCIVRFCIGVNYFYKRAAHGYDWRKAHIPLLRAIHKTQHWPIIKKYIQIMFANTDLAIDGRMTKILADIDNEIYITDDILYFIEYIDIIWSILDASGYNAFYRSKAAWLCTKGLYLEMPLLLPKEYIVNILDNWDTMLNTN